MSEYVENSISKNWSNVRILTSTATYAKLCIFYEYKIVIKKSKKYIRMLTNIRIYRIFKYSLLLQILKPQCLYEINTYILISGSTGS